MPKVKNPLLSMEARGGIGGLVYNTWRGINYVKTNTSPTGQGTAKRLAAQALLALVSKLWELLTAPQRTGWTDYGTAHPVPDWTGSPKRLTGMNWFVKCNTLLRICGAAGISAAPSISAPDAPIGLTCSYATQAIRAVWTAPASTGVSVVFFTTHPQSAGISGRLEQAGYATNCLSSLASLASVVANPAAGRVTVFAKSVDRATGLVSTVVSTTVDSTGL